MDIRNIRILGTGMALPEEAVTSDELDRRLGLRAGTTLRQTGVRRRFLSTTETAAQLAASACTAALENAGLSWNDIDCLVGTSATMDQALPYNAALIHAELGLSAQRTSTFDIGASCMSFLTGLDTMSYLVHCGRYRNVMLVSSDIATFGLDWTRLKECGLFGDGAAALVIRQSAADEASRVLSSRTVTMSEGAGLCKIPAGGSRYHPRRLNTPIDPLTVFQMDGKSVFKLVAAEMADFTIDLLASSGVAMRDIALVVPHQASQLALDHLAKRLEVPEGRLVDIFTEYGNQVGASLPTALHIGLNSGRVQRGDAMLLIGTGAGITMGGMVLTY